VPFPLKFEATFLFNVLPSTNVGGNRAISRKPSTYLVSPYSTISSL
jgi:hypothetical protein